jgi:hypothetical protein
MSDGIHLRQDGTVEAYVGPKAVNFFRMRMIAMGLRTEATGMKLSRGISCYKIAKTEYGLKGNLAKVTTQFDQILAQATAQQQVVRPEAQRIQG